MSNLIPSFNDLTPSHATTLNVGQWYQSEFIPGVPDTIAPYLAAHGFIVSGGAPYEIDGEFAGFLVHMQRSKFSHGDAIQSLLNAMVFAYNEGRVLNDRRYEDILAGMNQTLAHQQAHADSTETSFNADYALIVADLDAITADAPSLADWTSALEALDDKIDAYDISIAALIASYTLSDTVLLATITTAFTKLTDALATYRGEVVTLKSKQAVVEASMDANISTENTNLTGDILEINAALDALDDEYDTHLASANAALTSMELAIATFATDSATIIDAMEASQDAHEIVIGTLLTEVTTAFTATEGTLTSLLADLSSDYTSHVTAATAFLTDLGVTELARINETHDNRQSANNQRLVNNGFSSSAIFVQMEAQVLRERNEDISKHNDMINREKFENQHRLYGQQQAFRGTHIAVHQQLSATQQQTIQFRIDATERLNSQSQNIRQLSLQSRQETERLRTTLFSTQIGVSESYGQLFFQIKSQVVSGKSDIQRARVAVTRGHAGDYQGIFTQIAETFARSLSGEDQFARLDAQLRSQQQTVLLRLEDLGQSWSQTQAGMLESAINRRGDSARIDAQVRQSYYDTIMRLRFQTSQGRLGATTAKADLLKSHVDETTKVASALFAFSERREDSFPGIGDMAALVTSLGDDQ
jgi:hypothetical protein